MGSLSFTQKMTGGAIKYVAPVARGQANGLVAEVYGGAEREFALVPPLTMHSLEPEILAGFWEVTREAFIVGREGRADRELVAAAVSQSNACPFCVEVHSAMLHATGSHGLADVILDAHASTSSAHPLVRWALATRTPGAVILAEAPFPNGDGPQLRATAVLFHYLNRMVNVFLEPSPSPIALRSHRMKAMAGRAFGTLVGKRIVNIDALPGQGFTSLPDANLPPEFAWAAGVPTVARALARFNAAIEQRGEQVIAPAVWQVVRNTLQNWNGEDPGLSMHWLDKPVAGLSHEKERAAARLALLAAIASYRVDETTVAEFCKHHPGPGDLITTVAWASFEAARRIGSWIAPSPDATVRIFHAARDQGATTASQVHATTQKERG